MSCPRLKLAVAVLRPPAPSGQRLPFAHCQPALRNSIRTEARLPAPQRGIVAGYATTSASWSNAAPTWGEDWRRRTRAACQLRGPLSCGARSSECSALTSQICHMYDQLLTYRLGEPVCWLTSHRMATCPLRITTAARSDKSLRLV